MDNNSPSPHSTPIGLITMWCMTAITNFLAFAPTVSLDDIQKVAAIVASIVVAVITVMTYFRKKK